MVVNAQGRNLSPASVRTVATASLVDDADRSIVPSTHTLILWDHDDHDDEDNVEAATVESYLVDPTIDPEWMLAMDSVSQDLCDVGEVLLFEYERLCEALQQDASQRRADNGRFVVLSELHTPAEHRGNQYGLLLLDEVIAQSLRNAVFVVGFACTFDEGEATFAERSDSLVELFTKRFGARVLDQRLMVIP